jgi:hypothetical protein
MGNGLARRTPRRDGSSTLAALTLRRVFPGLSVVEGRPADFLFEEFAPHPDRPAPNTFSSSNGVVTSS